MSKQATVRCARCELVQFADKATCRRCHASLKGLPAVNPDVIDPPLTWPQVTLPTVAQVQRSLLFEAATRTGNNGKAMAAMLGIGKTTVYRHMDECGLVPVRRRRA